jgi:hypothetical protein
VEHAVTRPWWVRFQLLGIPDRITAVIVWWLLFAAAVGLPIYCLRFANFPEGRRLPAAVLLGVLCTTSAICTGYAIRWMDRHRAWNGR